MMDVEITSHRPDAVTVVGLHGELDIDAAVHLQAVFFDLVDRLSTHIVVDLAGLTSCDPVSLLTFVNAHRSCTQLSGYLRLAAPPPVLLPTLAAVGRLTPIPIYATVEAACTDDPTHLTPPADQTPGGSHPAGRY